MLYTSKKPHNCYKKKGLQGRKMPFYICNTPFWGNIFPSAFFSHNLTAVFRSYSSCRVKKVIRKVRLSIRIRIGEGESKKNTTKIIVFYPILHIGIYVIYKSETYEGDLMRKLTKTFIVSLTLCIAFTLWGLFPNLLWEKVA